MLNTMSLQKKNSLLALFREVILVYYYDRIKTQAIYSVA
jgi:hypothetical protein